MHRGLRRPIEGVEREREPLGPVERFAQQQRMSNVLRIEGLRLFERLGRGDRITITEQGRSQMEPGTFQPGILLHHLLQHLRRLVIPLGPEQPDALLEPTTPEFVDVGLLGEGRDDVAAVLDHLRIPPVDPRTHAAAGDVVRHAVLLEQGRAIHLLGVEREH